jgi:hypothetical protein
MPIDLGTPEALTIAAGAVLSLVFILFPPARRWFTEQDGDTQKALTGGLILLVAAAAVLGSCAGVLDAVACEQASIVDYVIKVAIAGVLGLATNRTLFSVARVTGRSRAQARTIGAPPTRSKLLDA